MPSICIYFEGGGDHNRTRELLLPGMTEFLSPIKQLARDGRWQWKLIACGGREEAYNKFTIARKGSKQGDIIVLLVDAEGDIPDAVPTNGGFKTQKIPHLRSRRGDNWPLENVPEDNVHVMAQTMETWLIADIAALEQYYGQGFRASSLPRQQNLEKVAKVDCSTALIDATRNTSKGVYHKIKHAKDLLGKLDREKVKSRCPHARILFEELTRMLSSQQI